MERELREETGWEVEAGPLIDEGVWIYEPVPGRRVLIVTYCCRVLTPDRPPVRSHEYKEIGLFTPGEVPGCTCPRDTRRRSEPGPHAGSPSVPRRPSLTAWCGWPRLRPVARRPGRAQWLSASVAARDPALVRRRPVRAAWARPLREALLVGGHAPRSVGTAGAVCEAVVGSAPAASVARRAGRVYALFGVPERAARGRAAPVGPRPVAPRGGRGVPECGAGTRWPGGRRGFPRGGHRRLPAEAATAGLGELVFDGGGTRWWTSTGVSTGARPRGERAPEPGTRTIPRTGWVPSRRGAPAYPRPSRADPCFTVHGSA
ncbi:hypothetical protein ACFYT4_00940 [Streptomyces sp. NPDC004609]|uniref:hypothetical protein n=1 Tax=Streptomyces sp. NPDC004609 TaxID=3364704 RepID=UPI0036CF7C13